MPSKTPESQALTEESQLSAVADAVVIATASVRKMLVIEAILAMMNGDFGNASIQFEGVEGKNEYRLANLTGEAFNSLLLSIHNGSNRVKQPTNIGVIKLRANNGKTKEIPVWVVPTDGEVGEDAMAEASNKANAALYDWRSSKYEIPGLPADGKVLFIGTDTAGLSDKLTKCIEEMVREGLHPPEHLHKPKTMENALSFTKEQTRDWFMLWVFAVNNQLQHVLASALILASRTENTDEFSIQQILRHTVQEEDWQLIAGDNFDFYTGLAGLLNRLSDIGNLRELLENAMAENMPDSEQADLHSRMVELARVGHLAGVSFVALLTIRNMLNRAFEREIETI